MATSFYTPLETTPTLAVCMTDKDYTSGGRRCAELAFLVHEELSDRGLLSELERRGHFEWTRSPEVRARVCCTHSNYGNETMNMHGHAKPLAACV